MAQPTNTFDSYDMVGIREDLEDKIYDVSPSETPGLSMMAKTRATQRNHEWQTDVLRSSANNATIEGDDLTARAITPTVRLGNYVQIFSDAWTISDFDTNLDKAGRAKEMGYQLEKAVKEVKLDGERALYLNNAKVLGNSTTASEMAGTQTWFTSNTSNGATGSDATGDGTDTRTAGTARALTQTLFDTVMQSCYDNSGNMNRVAILSSGQMNTALGFTGNNNQRANVQASEKKTYNVMDVYITPFGDVEFVLSRECPTSEIHILDPKMWCIAEKKQMRNFPLAKTGLAEKRGMDWEWTLVCKNEASSGLIADLS